MNKKLTVLRMRNILTLCAIVFGLSVSFGHANSLGGQVPQIPAFLPYSTDVPMTKKLPIDGEWVINNIRKRIRIEGGRAYAVDSWLHLFVLKIQPLMVVSKNWRRTGKGKYEGEDLPLLGPFTATLDPSGNMQMRVQGAMGPVNLTLSPVRLDSRRRFDRELAGGSRRDDEDDDYEDEEEYPDDEGYPDDEDDYYDEEEEYSEDEEEYSDDEGYPGDEEWDSDEEEFDEEEFDEEGFDEEEDFEEEQPKKIAATKHGKAKKGCKGKQIYQSGGSCYECPKGYRRFSVARKMTHPKACTKRGPGSDKKKAKYKWEYNGCPKGQFKHKGYCKSCPDGTKRLHAAGLDTGKCKVY